MFRGSHTDHETGPWNKGKLIGQKQALSRQEIWSIGTRSFVVRGWCGVHDPTREHRSTRADTGRRRSFLNRL